MKKIKLLPILLLLAACSKNLNPDIPLVGYDNEMATSAITGVDAVPQDNLPADYQVVFSDQFNNNNIEGSGLDFWKYRTDPATHNGFTGYNSSSNVIVENNLLKINFTRDNNNNFTGGGIISKKEFGYGYYEAKIKFYIGNNGLHQSFWTYSSTEIDACELESGVGTITTNLHKWIPGYGSGHRSAGAQSSVNVGQNALLSDWVTIGFLYTQGSVKYYVNGVEKRTTTSSNFADFPILDAANIWLTALPFDKGSGVNWPWGGAHMEVDYVYYARPKSTTGINLVSNKDFSIHKPSTVAPGVVDSSIQGGWLTGEPGSVNGMSNDANYTRAHRNTIWSTGFDGSDKWLLEHKRASSYTGNWNTNTYQYLNYLANGKYYLKLRYKTVSTNSGAYNQVILKNIKDNITYRSYTLPDNTNGNGSWQELYIGLNDDSISIADSPEQTALIFRTNGVTASDKLVVDFVGFYRKGN